MRDITGQTDIPMTIGHYLRSMKQLANQWTPTNFRDERRQRLYLKDIDCPPEWFDHLRKVIPASLFYMNENVEEKVNLAARGQADDGFDVFDDGFHNKKSAIAGDLMSSLPEEMRAQNLMCYIGHEGTYTPAHKEMCASLGQNIMVEASKSENGENPGSSIWFMTESKDREVIREYFLSILGHDIEIEKHFAQINAWKKATFPVYIVEQKVGDFILIPPLAPHQVWNRGTRTMKVAWNRTTSQTLKLALQEALPKARLVCRDEQYKNKAIIYYTLRKYYKELSSMDETVDNGWLELGQDLVQNSPRMEEMARDFKDLFQLYTGILEDEMFYFHEKAVEFIDFDSNITCSYCRCNIFNRFLTCKHCVRLLINGNEDTYDVCMECYAMGRSCICTSDLQWCEQFSWSQLVEEHEAWRSMIIKNDGFVDINHSPQPLEIARRLTGKKSAAQICQEQLRRRPFKDITKEMEKENGDVESSDPELDEGGRLKKKRNRRNKVKKGETSRCHVCCHRELLYKLQHCSTPGCCEAYCYGVLYRAFDMMPQQVMENAKWTCPKCLGICNCAACRKSGQTQPYEPKNTLLGHDTRPIADDRSIEALVDFRVHNLSWLKVVGEESRNKNSKRMQRLQAQAQAEKAKDGVALEDAIGEDEGMTAEQVAALRKYVVDSATVDPATGGGEGAAEGEDEGESSYPDPANLYGRERMCGLGYYQQDEGADRILFDPYQAPTAEALEEPQVSEYVKRTVRAAKRKTRQETDGDLEYQGPRIMKKKKTQDGGATDIIDHIDPAMLGGSEMAQDAAESLRQQPTQPAAAGEDWVHRPYLRNARPIASYAEPEEPLMEELEDPVFDPLAQLSQLDGSAIGMEGKNDKRDTLDLADDAGDVLVGDTTSLGQAAQKRKRKSYTTNRNAYYREGLLRRDRDFWMPAVPIVEDKPKHRVTRASLLAEGLTEEEAAEKLRELHSEHDHANDALGLEPGGMEVRISRHVDIQKASESESHLSVESDDPNDKSFCRPYGAKLLGIRPGRKPKIWSSSSAGRRSMPAVLSSSETPGRRGRPGRPPKNRYSDGAAPETSPASRKPTRLVSLADRMAIRGRKFKIGGKRGPVKTPKASNGRGFTAVNTTSAGLSVDEEGAQPTAPPAPMATMSIQVSTARPPGHAETGMPLRSSGSSSPRPSASANAPSQPGEDSPFQGHSPVAEPVVAAAAASNTGCLRPLDITINITGMSKEQFASLPANSPREHVAESESHSPSQSAPASGNSLKNKDRFKNRPSSLPQSPVRRSTTLQDGPTIVSLGTYSEDKEEDAHYPGSTPSRFDPSPTSQNVENKSDDDSSDDDEGIPATRKAHVGFVASRGARGGRRPLGSGSASALASGLRGASRVDDKSLKGRRYPPGRRGRRGRGRGGRGISRS